MGRDVGGWLCREGRILGTSREMYLWLIHVDVGQKPSQYCKVVILQLKIKLHLKKEHYIQRQMFLSLQGCKQTFLKHFAEKPAKKEKKS